MRRSECTGIFHKFIIWNKFGKMVQTCCIKNCKERQNRDTNISFHKFPEDPQLREKWIKAINSENFEPSAHSRVCSKHFGSDFFVGTYLSSRRNLTDGAVPFVSEVPEVPLAIEVVNVPSIEIEGESASLNNEFTNESNSFESAEFQEIPPKRMRISYIGDFLKSDVITDQETFKHLVAKTLAEKNKQIKALQRTNKRLFKKVEDLQELLDELRDSGVINEDTCVMFYPPELKTFALTLHFYSPRAYDYVRNTFNSILQHPRTIQKWYATIECQPGFHTESINTLKLKVAECESKSRACVCALMIDEMSIHKKIEWDGQKFIGYVDIGEHGGSDTPAKEAIVFLINCVNDRWKMPVGYFLVDSMTGKQKSNLILQCLRLLEEARVKVCSVTFDGISTNIAMAMSLGVELSSSCLNASFPHPITGESIHLVLDPPHMVKLIRNAFATCKTFYDKDNNEIKWEFLEHLVDVQEKEGLHLATKIARRHLNWFREKMKVRLATQLFSLSVAKALKYLRENYSEKFENSAATEKFLIIMNDAFDILNSRNILSKGFKGGLQKYNKVAVCDRINEIIEYITSLTYGPLKTPLHLSQKKTGFVGITISLRSLVHIYNQYVDSENDSKMKYLLSYKICQDHLEVLFSAIRSMGEHNNNPTVRQFQSAYKKLQSHTGVTGSLQANCIEQVPTIILAMSSDKARKVKTIDNLFVEGFDDDSFEEEDNDLDHNYFCTSENYAKNLSLYVPNIVEYIAGFVVKKIKKTVQCETCIRAVQSQNSQNKFFQIKNYSTTKQALTVPSSDVVQICKIAEAEIRIAERTNSLTEKNLMQKLILKTMYKVKSNVFKEFDEHMYDHNVESNHLIHLIKIVSYNYINIRLYYISNKNVDKDNNTIRNKLTKTILFCNQ